MGEAVEVDLFGRSAKGEKATIVHSDDGLDELMSGGAKE
jgi:hypothetical protein